jgi:hypothetical protein
MIKIKTFMNPGNLDEQSRVDQNQSYDKESIIENFLDIINIKSLLRIVLNKTGFKFSNSFIRGLIVLIFLIWLYYFADYFWKTVILVVLIFSLILDFSGKNFDFIRKYLFNEDNNKAFLENIGSYPLNEAYRQTILRRFTPSNISFYLNKIRENPEVNLKIEYGFVLENFVQYNELSIENLNIFLSENFLNFNVLRDNIIIIILLKYKDKLSQNHLVNLYNHYGSDEKIKKYIIATQNQSEFLIKNYTEMKTYKEKIYHADSQFSELRRKLPVFPKDRLNLLNSLFFIGVIMWGSLSFSIIFLLNEKIPILINGYISSAYPYLSIISFLIAGIYSFCLMSILYSIFDDKLIKNLEDFRTFVEKI